MRSRTAPSFAASLLLGLAACSGASTATPEAQDGTTMAGATASPAAGSAQEPDGQEDPYAEVFAAVEGLTGQERRDQLIALAEQEQDATLYTSLNAEIAEELLSAYESATGMAIDLYRASSDTLGVRLLEEVQAGVSGADVVENTGTEMSIFNLEGVLREYEPPNLDDLLEGADQDGWTAARFNVFTTAYNTDLVSPDDLPTSYQELADPKWDGRLIMEIKDAEWYKAVYEYLVEEQGLSEEQADELFANMAEGAVFVNGHSSMRQMILTGQYALGASDYSYGVDAQSEAGAPIAWRPPIEPLFARPLGVGLVKNASNPASAVLFYDWLLTDGQAVLDSLGIDPTLAELSTFGELDIRAIDPTEFVQEADVWEQKYEDLARLGEVAQ